MRKAGSVHKRQPNAGLDSHEKQLIDQKLLELQFGLLALEDVSTPQSIPANAWAACILWAGG
jgi:hypothetical protein